MSIVSALLLNKPPPVFIQKSVFKHSSRDEDDTPESYALDSGNLPPWRKDALNKEIWRLLQDGEKWTIAKFKAEINSSQAATLRHLKGFLESGKIKSANGKGVPHRPCIEYWIAK